VTVIGPAAGITESSLQGIFTDPYLTGTGSGVPDFLEGLNPASSTAEARAWQSALDAMNSTPDGRQYLQEMGNAASLSIFSNGPAVPGDPVPPGLLAAEVYDPSSNQFMPGALQPADFAFAGAGQHANQGEAAFGGFLTTYDVAAANSHMLSAEQVWAVMQTAAIAAGTELNQYLTPGSGPGHTIPNLNLNQFLTDEIPLRVVSWREL
jgi:hypothetical protein